MGAVQPSTSQSQRRSRLWLLSLAVSIAALYLVCRDLSWQQVWQQRERVQLGTFAYTYLITAVGFACLMRRIQVLAGSTVGLPSLTALRSIFAGYVGNAVLPARIGEILKAAYLGRKTDAKLSATLGWIATERVLDLSIVLLCAVWIVPWVMGADALGGAVYLALPMVIAGLAVLVLAALRPSVLLGISERLLSMLSERVWLWFRPKVEQFVAGLGVLRDVRIAVQVLFWTVLYWASNLATMHVWTLAFDLQTPWYAAFLLLAFLALGTALPAAAAYIGTYHFAVVAALGAMGVAKKTGVAVAVFVHAATIVPWVVVGALLLLPELARGHLRNT